jgi:hypothetical protein
VETLDVNETMRRGADLLEFKANVPVTDGQFVLPALPADWQREDKVYRD